MEAGGQLHFLGQSSGLLSAPGECFWPLPGAFRELAFSSSPWVVGTQLQKLQLAAHQGALTQCRAAATERGSQLPKELWGRFQPRECRKWTLPSNLNLRTPRILPSLGNSLKFFPSDIEGQSTPGRILAQKTGRSKEGSWLLPGPAGPGGMQRRPQSHSPGFSKQAVVFSYALPSSHAVPSIWNTFPSHLLVPAQSLEYS